METSWETEGNQCTTYLRQVCLKLRLLPGDWKAQSLLRDSDAGLALDEVCSFGTTWLGDSAEPYPGGMFDSQLPPGLNVGGSHVFCAASKGQQDKERILPIYYILLRPCQIQLWDPQNEKDLLEGVQKRPQRSSRGWSRVGGMGCSPGEEKASGHPQSSFQSLKGLQGSWRRTWERGFKLAG